MDASLQQLTRVERLDLSHNLIAKVENTEHMYRLGYLNLGHNQLTSVADINLVLGNVTVLVLRENRVSAKNETNLCCVDFKFLLFAI